MRRRGGETVRMVPARPFALSLHTAHTWTVSQTTRYLEEVMEMPQYTSNFLRGSVTGKVFAGMSIDSIPASVAQVSGIG